MIRRRTLKHKKSLRRAHSRRAHSHRNKRKSGGGWSDLSGTTYKQVAVSPGYQIHTQYYGPGKDCTGNPYSERPGYIASYNPKGLPGLSGGKRSKLRRRKTHGGMAMPAAASTQFGSALPGPVPNPQLPPVSASLTQKPGDFPGTTGTGGTVANPNNLPVEPSWPGVPPPGMAQMPKMPIAELSQSADAANLAAPKQAGGRYGFFPGMGPLNPANGVGTTPAPFGRIPCESGTFNPFNPNPNGIQTATTAPLTPPYVTGKLAGGGSIPAGSGLAASAANFPTVQVGQADSMRYYAQNAGYGHGFEMFKGPSAIPGLMTNIGYPAGAFNQACIKTGGGKKNRRNGGANPVALDAGEFTPVTMGEVMTRKDFDGTNQGLPVKFGGKRRSHKRRVLKNKRKTHRNRK